MVNAKILDKAPAGHRDAIISTLQKGAAFFTRDARHYQIAFLSIFLAFGCIGLNWEISLARLLVTFGTCIGTQMVCTHFTTKDHSSVKSALISALSLCLMLKTNLLWVSAFAAFLSIGSKFLIRVKGKHVFNPTNFGIIVSLLVTGQAWISPGQWGSDAMLLFMVGILGLSVLIRVKRLDTAIAFLIGFCGLAFSRSVIYQGWELDHFFLTFSSGTLLLFTFFMITDPAATPSHKWARIIWAFAVGALAFYLQAFKWVNGAPLWALFFLSPLTIVLDRIFKGEKFSWIKK
jgi:Na+-transporting NADH:ubiquinone oxidoreductase subunit NqrB